MRFITIFIRQGFFYTEKFLKNGFNLIFSEKNGKGKTTLLRCLLYSLGYNIPGTKNFDMNSTSTSLLIEKDNGEIVGLERNREDYIEYSIDNKKETFSLPYQHNKMLSLVFGTENTDILNNMLGAIYADQEKGWTLLNRGKAIAGISFNIDELIRGLSNINCDELLNRKKAIEFSLKKYQQIFNIAQYRDSVSVEVGSFVERKYNEERFIQMQQLQIEREQLQAEIKRLDQNISENKKVVDLINELKLIVQTPDGHEMCVTKKDVVGYKDSVNYLKAKKAIKSARLQKVLSQLESVTLTIAEEDKQLTLFKTESLADVFDRNIINIPIDSIEVKKAISVLEEEYSTINKEISSRTNYMNPVTMSMYENVRKYMQELGVGDVVDQTWKFLFTSNLKELSGAVLHKTVFSFRLAYIIEIQKVLGIKLPIILDSPSGKEVDKDNINQMIKILKRVFSENQIIIASIYHYVDDEHVIELKTQVLDQY